MLRRLTTIRRLVLVLFVFLAWTPAAYAWSWPVQGPVLHPFAYDEANPYAAGQHRGVDIGADAAGATVLAPAAGTVSFAGNVAANGRSITIETADGYSVTLTHLGSIGVVKGATVAEGDSVGTVGPSGTPEVDGPYVHLGIRVTTDPNGYVDPLSLLPPAADNGTTTSQTTTTSAAPARPASQPARSVPRPARAAARPASTPETHRTHVSTRERGHEHASKPNAQPRRSANRPTVRDARAPVETATPRPRVRRPFEEPAADLPTGPVAQTRLRQSRPLPAVVCNGAVALFALALAFAAVRLRRRPKASPVSGVEILHVATPVVGARPLSRAA
jgi:peptidase M23-like protein